MSESLGPMTPSEEFDLYRNDYPAWIEYVAPRWRDILAALPPNEKREWWDSASPAQKQALRDLKKREASVA